VDSWLSIDLPVEGFVEQSGATVSTKGEDTNINEPSALTNIHYVSLHLVHASAQKNRQCPASVFGRGGEKSILLHLLRM